MHAACPKHGEGCRYYVPPSGDPETAKLAIIGEGPGEEELERGIPFVGPAGRKLWHELEQLGISRDSCWVYNAVPCPGGPTPHTPSAVETREWRDHVLSYLARVKAPVVLLLGRYAVYSVLAWRVDTINISRRSGEIVERDGRRYVLSIHPAAVLRNPREEIKLQYALRRVAKCLGSSIDEDSWYPGHKIVDDLLLLQEAEDALLRSSGGFSFDIESDKGRPYIIGLYTPGHPVFIVKLFDWQGSWQPDVVRNFLDNLFRNVHPRVGHNVNYDVRLLRRHGYLSDDLYATIDTWLAAHLLDPHRYGSLGLKDLGRSVLGIAPYDNVLIEGQTLSHWLTRDIRKIPLDLLAEYCGKDCVVAYQLHEYCMRELVKDDRLNRLYFGMIMPVNQILLDIGETGIPVNLEEIERLENEWQGVLDSVDGRLRQYANINWGSHKQVSEYLYKTLGLTPPKFTNKGEPSTDEESLLLLRDEHESVGVLLEYREVAKRLSTIRSLKEHVVDGRLYTVFKLAGTVSGRSSTEPNVQNFERGPGIRDIVCAGDGYVLVEADLSQIELRWMAEVYQEESLKKAVVEGLDLHRRTAALAFGKPESEVTDVERTLGKTVNFSAGYGSGVSKLAGILRKQGRLTRATALEILGGQCTGDPVQEVARRLYRGFHSQFPGVRAAHDRIRAQLRENGYVTSAFGRRYVVHGEFDALPDHEQDRLVREAANFVVQSPAADTLWICLQEIFRPAREMGARIVNVVHDSILAEVPESVLDQYVQLVAKVMHNPPFDKFGVSISVPIASSIKVGRSWGSMKEYTVQTVTGTPEPTLRDYFDRYYENGWSVVPVAPGEKIPAVDWTYFQSHRADKNTISQWVRLGGVGIVTGRVSGLVVVDVDLRGLSKAEELGLDSPVKVRTGSGGLHLYYRYPESGTVGTTTGLWEGIDIRGDGGFVVAPPTLHASGQLYRFECPFDQVTPLNLPALPDIVLEALASRQRPRSSQQPVAVTLPRNRTMTDEQKSGIVHLIAPYWSEGNRHQLALGLVGMLAKWGYREDDVADLIERIVHETGDPEEKDRLRAVADTYDKLAAGLPVVGAATVEHLAGVDVVEAVRSLCRVVPRIPNADCYWLGEFLEDETVTPQWLIEGLLPVAGIAQLAGHPGSGKTTLAFQIGAQVSAGLPVLGEWPVPTPRTVLYIQADNPAPMMKHLARDVIAHVPVAAWNCVLVSVKSPIHIDTEHGYELIARLCRSFYPGLVVFDTIRDFHCSDENSPNATALVLENIKRLRTEFNTAILYLNHVAKSQGYKRAAIEAHLGSTRWVGPTDLSMVLEQEGDAPDGLVKLTFAKVRWAEKPASRMLTRQGWWFTLGG